MQSISATSTAGTVYSAAQVIAQLKTGASERWRFDWISASGIGDATQYIHGGQPPVVTHDSLAAVKRTITFLARGDWKPAWLRDLIRPRYGLLMPDGGWCEWYLGTFSMELPASQIMPGQSIRTVKGFDLSQTLADGKFLSGYSIAGSVNGTAAVNTLLGLASYSGTILAQIPDLGRKLAQPLGWQVGDSILAAVNTVLEAMTYQTIAADENGVLRSQPYPDYNTVVAAYTFDTTVGASLVKSPLNGTIDMSKAINFCRTVVEDPRTAADGFFADYSNVRPDSPVSIPNWHLKPMVVKDSKIVDIPSAYARSMLEVQRGASIYQTIPVETIPWPFSQDQDVYGLVYNTPDEGLVAANYLELGWTHVCKTGSPTVHKLRRLVAA